MAREVDRIVVGASCRAAVHSLRRAGLVPYWLDVFGDRDVTNSLGRPVPADAYPFALPKMLADAPDAPWFYAGGLENHPSLIARMAKIRPLLGHNAKAVRKARDPHGWTDALADAGFPTLKLSHSRPEIDDRPYLVKPYDGTGGRGIRPYEPDMKLDPTREFLQAKASGERAFSTIFTPDGLGGWRASPTCVLWSGADDFGAGPFSYSGNAVPPASDRSETACPQIAEMGRVIAEYAGLSTMFGLDHAKDRRGRDVVLEVNPRYVASAELVEFQTGRALLADPTLGLIAPPQTDESTRWRAKGVLYAPADGTFPEAGPWEAAAGDDPWRMPRFADVPHAGAGFRKGQPLLTVFAAGDSEAECREMIMATMDEVRATIRT